VEVIREELRRLFSWEGHHRRLIARLVLALALTLVVDAVGAILTYALERHADGDIHSFGDAVFFSTVQLLTVSSQIKNPLTPWGRVVDVFLEVWALVVVTGVAGSFAAFFSAADRRLS
jgi:drug/metabolite transporter (DMT)-like permease